MLGSQVLLAKSALGGATPLVVLIGLGLIIVGGVMMFRGKMLLGVVAIIVGIVLGGLSVF